MLIDFKVEEDEYGFILNGYNHLIESTNSLGEKNSKILKKCTNKQKNITQTILYNNYRV